MLEGSRQNREMLVVVWEFVEMNERYRERV